MSKAIGILSDPEGFSPPLSPCLSPSPSFPHSSPLKHIGMAISKRKIVVSTAGVVPNMAKLMEDWPQVQLAVSLHAVTDEVGRVCTCVNGCGNIKTRID